MDNLFKPLCVFCSAPWSDDNISLEDVEASRGCETCGYGSGMIYTINIICHECGKLMYQKEGILEE